MSWANGALVNISGVEDFSLQYWYCDECGKESWTLLEGSWDDVEKSKVALMEAGFLYNAAKWGGIGDVDELHPHKCEGG